VKPLDFPLLADENIHPEVVAALIQSGKDVQTIGTIGLLGYADIDILHFAYEQGRVVLTHDSDFGKLAIQANEPFVGIIYLRPGHITASFTINVLRILDDIDDVKAPFILVAERRADDIRFRYRHIILTA